MKPQDTSSLRKERNLNKVLTSMHEVSKFVSAIVHKNKTVTFESDDMFLQINYAYVLTTMRDRDDFYVELIARVIEDREPKEFVMFEVYKEVTAQVADALKSGATGEIHEAC